MLKRKKILCLLFGACIGAMLLSGCGKNGGSDTGAKKENKANPLEKEGYVLDWHDEFDGDELDTSVWLPQHQPHRSTSLAGSTAKYKIGDGSLKLYIDEDTVNFYDGSEGGFRVSSIQTYEKTGLHIGDTVTTVAPFNGYVTQYGYFEMRCKMPSCGGGGCVAWWMIGAEYDADAKGEGSLQDGEIDIFETFYDGTNTMWPKVHPWNDADLTEWEAPTVLEDGDYINEWHTYAMDWTPEYLAFFVDGKEIARTEQSPQYDMCMYLSMYASDDENYWAGGASNDVYPKEWEIDYVRVYKDVNGYPNAKTKSKEPVDAHIEKIKSEAYMDGGDPATDFGINDVARQAEVTTTVEPAKNYTAEQIKNIIKPNFDLSSGWCSKDNPEMPGEFTFTWSSPQNVDTVNLYNRFAVGQAPTKIEVQVQKNGGEWTSVAEYTLQWLTSTDTVEYVKMAVPDGDGITGLKLIVKDANLEWKHYTISRVHIYKSGN